jgi:ribosomal protein L11 methyltransferase
MAPPDFDTDMDLAPGATGPWTVLRLELPAELADELVGRLAVGTLGAELEPSPGGRIRIAVFLRSPRRIDAALESARGLLAELDLDSRRCRLRAEQVEDGRWVEKYQALLQPIPIGARFVVHASRPSASADSDAALSGRQAILLAPGGAFGTGEHATTQLCVARLERWVGPGEHWVDLGCGTGILSIVAQRCGAEVVLAVDRDADAVAVARQVLRANELRSPIEVRRGSIEQAATDQPWNGVVANIHAPFFIERSAEIAAVLEMGGLLVSSGFLREDLAEVARAAREAGLVELERDVLEPWAVWVGRREAGGG